MMLTELNLADEMAMNRPYRSNREGFGSLLPQHDRENERRHMNSEYRDYVGNQPEFSRNSKALEMDKLRRHAGTVHKPDEILRKRQNANLMGERLMEHSDS